MSASRSESETREVADLRMKLARAIESCERRVTAYDNCLRAVEERAQNAERELGLLRPLAVALERNEAHGNLSGRAEDAWYLYTQHAGRK